MGDRVIGPVLESCSLLVFAGVFSFFFFFFVWGLHMNVVNTKSAVGVAMEAP